MENFRVKLHDLMKATVSDEKLHHDWSYVPVRPMYVPSSWHPSQHVVGDCSKGVQFLCKWAGAPDPMRANFDGYGNSETLTLKLPHVSSPEQLDVGDIITFGVRGEKHAAMVLEKGNDPLLWSFGHQGAPNTYRLSQDSRPRHYLKLNLPPYTLSRADKLRLKTGYWAWVQWKLGEGDWHGYSPANKNVRPNVKRVIPILWWKQYSQFLLNRKKANKASLEV